MLLSSDPETDSTLMSVMSVWRVHASGITGYCYGPVPGAFDASDVAEMRRERVYICPRVYVPDNQIAIARSRYD